MAYKKSHPIYSKDAAVYIETGNDKLTVLQQAIDKSGFHENIDGEFKDSGKTKEEFLIVIKPNIMTASIHEDPSPVYTDPQMVEYLIKQLRDKGFTNIAVVEARNVYDYGYTGRDVKTVADLAGYKEDGYRIEDLSEQKEPFDYGGVLGEHVVGRTWKDADYRISFAKNKTHWQCFYTGCLKNIYGCLPEWDKNGVYHGRGPKGQPREFYECCILIVDRFPVHFGFMDAWVSGDGFTGHVRDANPNQTHSVFASENIFALDWVQGEKMNIDPAINHVIQEAMHRWGAIHITRKGNMTPWRDWTNVGASSIMALDFVEELYWLARVLSRAFATTQDKRFKPIKRWQWFFAPIQFLIRTVEKIFSPKRRGRRKH
ncbi:MAG: DUF362 domain-containing protein [bacterium]|nr:DUF362 domain-containing protein [bacterium]